MAEHMCKMVEPKMFKIIKVHDDYSGTPGDRSFLYKTCEGCRKGEVYDYGTTPDLEVKLEAQLIVVNNP